MSVREQTIALINEATDDEVAYFFHVLSLRRLQEQQRKQATAWETLHKYRGKLHVGDDFDYKAELAGYRDERYANPS
ncbi:MAG: DsrE family protein [Oscillospiraceae bacterium]|nr:DsrE family protein [Oscillospiraceae bacterium]